VAASEKPPSSGQKARPPGPFAMVILGASGDLTKRKLIPAIYNLATAQLVPAGFAIVGMATSPMSADEFRSRLARDVPEHLPSGFNKDLREALLAKVTYVSGDFRDAAAYSRLAAALAQVEQEHGTAGNAIFYLATPPQLIGEIVRRLAEAELVTTPGGCFRRVVIEKPFGSDLDSARALDSELGESVKENQIYRIDHYLGKETVQNILVLRFGNGIFEPLWNSRYIDNIQITVAESIGVGTRGN
jgi:glucose-6-phosphate 1-dehydrogenase